MRAPAATIVSPCRRGTKRVHLRCHIQSICCILLKHIYGGRLAAVGFVSAGRWAADGTQLPEDGTPFFPRACTKGVRGKKRVHLRCHMQSICCILLKHIYGGRWAADGFVSAGRWAADGTQLPEGVTPFFPRACTKGCLYEQNGLKMQKPERLQSNTYTVTSQGAVSLVCQPIIACLPARQCSLPAGLHPGPCWCKPSPTHSTSTRSRTAAAGPHPDPLRAPCGLRPADE
jgi:hypothetical protein